MFAVLFPLSEIFQFWPIKYSFVYFDSLPIALGLVSATFLVCIIRLQIKQPELEALFPSFTFVVTDSLASAGAMGFTVLYLWAVELSFVNYFIFILNAISLYFCAKIIFTIFLALFGFAITGRT